jgi:hypothetical protein
LVFADNSYGMDYARVIAKDRQHNIDSELFANTYLQEYS